MADRMSGLRDIYHAITEMQVGDTKARDVDKVNGLVRLVDLPVRMIVPSQSNASGGFLGMGTVGKMTWRIDDTCLWESTVL
jgi:hypothetical protein